MTRAAELGIMIRHTAQFIAADPETIMVTPAEARLADGAGGFTIQKGEPFERTVRLLPQSDKVPVISTWEGTRERVEYILLDVPEAKLLLMKDDTFAWRGQVWKISQIHDKPDYEFKADVVLYGG